MDRSRVEVTLLLALTFVAGAAAGVASDRYLFAPDARAETRVERHEDRREGQTTIERFADDLGLTAEQRAEIAPILEDTRQRMRDVFDRVRPEYDAVVDSARARIEAVLTPEQARRYGELLQEQEQRRKERGREDR